MLRLANNLKDICIKLKNTGFLSIFSSSVINKIVNFAYGIILVRVISKADYGVYSYANNIYGYFALVLGLGTGGTILQVCSEDSDYDERYRHFRFCFSYGTYINIILSIVIVVISMTVSLPINGSDKLLRLMGFFPLFTQFALYYSPWLRSNFKSKEYSYLNILNTVAISALSVVGAFFYKADGLVVGRYLAAVITIMYALIVLKCPFPKLICIFDMAKFKDAKKIIKMGPVICLTESLIQVISLMGVSVLGHYVRDEIAIASFKTATTIPSALAFIPSSIMVYAFPYFARRRKDKKWTQKNFWVLIVGMFFMTSVIVLACELFAGEILVFVFGNQYADSAQAFRVLMIGFLVNSVLRIPAVNLVLSQWKLKFSALMAVIGFFVTWGINVVLVKPFGMIGSAYAQVLSVFIVGFVYTGYYLNVIYKKSDGNDSGE